MEKIKSDLMVPLFALYNFEKIKSIKFEDNDVEYLKDSYDLKDRKAIYNALVWAKDNPNFEFESVMQNAPISNKLSFSNSEIYQYLMKFKKFMEEDNGLITEESNARF